MQRRINKPSLHKAPKYKEWHHRPSVGRLPKEGETIYADSNTVFVPTSGYQWDGWTYRRQYTCCRKRRCRLCGGKAYAHGPYFYATRQVYDKAGKVRTKSVYIGSVLRSVKEKLAEAETKADKPAQPGRLHKTTRKPAKKVASKSTKKQARRTRAAKATTKRKGRGATGRTQTKRKA